MTRVQGQSVKAETLSLRGVWMSRLEILGLGIFSLQRLSRMAELQNDYSLVSA